MNEKNKDVIDLADARKRKKEEEKNRKKIQNAGPAKLKVMHWIQFILFLVVLAYFAQLCSGKR